MYDPPQTKKRSCQRGKKEKKDNTRRKKNALVPSLDRVVRDRHERVETVVMTCGTVDDVPGCGRVVQSCGIDRVLEIGTKSVGSGESRVDWYLQLAIGALRS